MVVLLCPSARSLVRPIEYVRKDEQTTRTPFGHSLSDAGTHGRHRWLASSVVTRSSDHQAKNPTVGVDGNAVGTKHPSHLVYGGQLFRSQLHDQNSRKGMRLEDRNSLALFGQSIRIPTNGKPRRKLHSTHAIRLFVRLPTIEAPRSAQ